MQPFITFFESFHTLVTADSPYWTVFGFLGNILFSARFIVQWYVSEKQKQSVIPVQFWYLSIAGSVIMLIYAVHLWKMPLILGFLFPVVIYMRNLALIAAGKKTVESLSQKKQGSGKEKPAVNPIDKAGQIDATEAIL